MDRRTQGHILRAASMAGPSPDACACFPAPQGANATSPSKGKAAIIHIAPRMRDQSSGQAADHLTPVARRWRAGAGPDRDHRCRSAPWRRCRSRTASRPDKVAPATAPKIPDQDAAPACPLRRPEQRAGDRDRDPPTRQRTPVVPPWRHEPWPDYGAVAKGRPEPTGPEQSGTRLPPSARPGEQRRRPSAR